MTPSPPLVIPTAAQVESFSGSLFVGSLLAWGLFGVLSTQVYMYSMAFTEDRLTIKTLVYAIYAVQLAQIVLFTIQGYQIVSGTLLTSMTCGLKAGFQGVFWSAWVFYAWRVWIISGRKIPSALILSTSVISLIGSFASAAEIKSIGHLSKGFVPKILSAVGVWEGSAALCDTLITGFMVYYLKCQSQKEVQGLQFKRTSARINRIICLIIETGLLTVGAAASMFIVTYIPGHKGYFIGILSAASGLYSNSFMVILNNRIKYSVHTHMTTWKEGETEVDNRLRFQNRPSTTGNPNSVKQHRSSFSGRGGVVITVRQEEMALESDFKHSTSTIIPESDPRAF